MALSAGAKTYYSGGFIAGVVGAIVFGIVAANSEGSRGAAIGAAVTCGLVAIVCVIVLLKNKQ